jgi:hypothetical protein
MLNSALWLEPGRNDRRCAICFVGKDGEPKVRFDDHAYYRERAEAEIDAADRAEHPSACTAHYVLAGFYLDLVHNTGLATADSGRSSEGG